MRDEVVLRTACGCTKIISAEYMVPTISVAIRLPRQHWVSETDPYTAPGYERRDFRQHHGERDKDGRPIYDEVLRPRLDAELNVARAGAAYWQKRYNDEVYGMDKGL